MNAHNPQNVVVNFNGEPVEMERVPYRYVISILINPSIKQIQDMVKTSRLFFVIHAGKLSNCINFRKFKYENMIAFWSKSKITDMGAIKAMDLHIGDKWKPDAYDIIKSDGSVTQINA